ncbi:MAG: DNA mismatch repair endonuclease MutL [Candidatus Pacebacteria bacterium]|nr:DNA mismatch repair endonuclease MutL [Candidatus Paceibacterota bacterium]
MAVIRLLPSTLVNRIAAGEVIERPAAAVKELVENSLDAGATEIEVRIVEGGKSLIRVSDNGWGMDREGLTLAIERHATSKLPEDDLVNIHSFGFRGEALPSIAAVSRLTVTSRASGSEEGWSLEIIGGEPPTVQPANRNRGTVVEVRDLFFATPARLKFLKTTRTETEAVVDVMERLAMAHPQVSFTLYDESRQRLNLIVNPSELTPDPAAAQARRLAAVMGSDFAANSIAIDEFRGDYRLSGLAGLPTLHRANQIYQYLFINGRPVKERLLYGCVRAAYSDFLPSNRHPMLALFLTLPSDLVDVNVHPAKTEVRFQDSAAVRSIIVNGLKKALAAAGHLASTTGGAATLEALQHSQQRADSDSRAGRHYGGGGGGGGSRAAPSNLQNWYGFRSQAQQPHNNPRLSEYFSRDSGDQSGERDGFAPAAIVPPVHTDADDHAIDENYRSEKSYPLGVARGQIHATYIVSETHDGLVIVDQHAAHERLVYEKLKTAMSEQGIDRQTLLLPELVELSERQAEAVINRRDELAKLGLVVEALGIKTIVVREIPTLLARANIPDLVRDLADEILELETGQTLKERLFEVAATIACHGSVRAGKILNGDEMNRLLREMEITPHSGQCNHGRPTWVELKLSDVERLFGRK